MIAFYMRLSIADGDVRNDEKEESNSIENQRAALYDFVARRKDLIGEVVEYIDDGYSGTNFERPQFKAMLEDMKAGKIDVLLTKDLSRLGRNYVEVGDYMEQIFPLLGVRYIAVNSNYDSNNYVGSTIGLEMSVMNLVNTLYCKDLSKKVRSGVETKWKSGKSTSGRPPFGYLPDPENKGDWIVEPEAAEIVRKIFQMAADGDGYTHIIHVLNDEKVPTPGQYREKHGHVRRVSRKVEDSEWLWTYENVWKILKTFEYTGALVHKKHTRIKVGATSSRRVPDDERIVIEGHHEPLVDLETYYKARSIIKEHKRGGVVNHDDYPLRGLIYCGNCGLRMHKPKAMDSYVVCKHREVAGKHSECSSEKYPTEMIDYLVRRSLRDQLLKLDSLRNVAQQGKTALPEYKKELARLTTEMKNLEVGKTRLYEQYADGFLERDAYIEKRDRIKEKLQVLNDKVSELKEPDESFAEILQDANHYLNLAEVLYQASEITEEAVKAFIEKIVIYDSEHIEIIFKFSDLLDELVRETDALREAWEEGESA